MSSGPVRCSRSRPRVADNLVAASEQLVDHLLTTVDRMDVHVTQSAGCVVETDPVPDAEPARQNDGPDGGGLLRSHCEPWERQTDTQFAATDVEASERPASDSVADECLDSEGPDPGRVRGRDVMRLVFHFRSAYERNVVFGSGVGQPTGGRGGREILGDSGC